MVADPKESQPVFLLYSLIAAGLVVMAGMMSGLTLGLLSLDTVELEVLKRSGTEKEKKYAQRIYPVLKRPHFLLVTLVLCNAAATEALPIVLDRLADPFTAVIISIVVVLVFGEIIPQALCSRYGLAVGAYSAWFVQALMYATSVISFPISLILDWTLGRERIALFRRAQLKALMDLHATENGLEESGYLTSDEVKIVRGALDLTQKTAMQCMTPIDKVFMLPADAILDEAMLYAILGSGYSRVPVYRRKSDGRREIVGLILVKELILVDKTKRTAVHELKLRSLPYLRADTALYDMLRLFEIGRCHMAVLLRPNDPAVRHRSMTSIAEDLEHASERRVQIRIEDDAPGDEVRPDEIADPVGIITIEDIIEEVIQQEIVDETDRYVDNNRQTRVNASLLMKSLPPRLRKILQSRQFLPRVGRLAAVKGSLRKSERNSVDDEASVHATSTAAMATCPSAPLLSSSLDGRPDLSLLSQRLDMHVTEDQLAELLEPLMMAQDGALEAETPHGARSEMSDGVPDPEAQLLSPARHGEPWRD